SASTRNVPSCWPLPRTCRTERPIHSQRSRFSLSRLPSFQPLGGQFDVPLRRLLRPPLECMQHEYPVSQCSEIDHPKSAALIPDPYLSHARTDRFHRLSVTRIEADLHRE